MREWVTLVLDRDADLIRCEGAQILLSSALAALTVSARRRISARTPMAPRQMTDSPVRRPSHSRLRSTPRRREWRDSRGRIQSRLPRVMGEGGDQALEARLERTERARDRLAVQCEVHKIVVYTYCVQDARCVDV